MKKRATMMLMVAALAAGACTTTSNMKRSEFDNRTYQVEMAMSRLGYYPVAFNAETVNEGHNDGEKWVDDYVWYDHRSFADSLGHFADYTMRYKKSGNMVLQVTLTGCSVTNARDYNKVCGSRSTVRSIIEGR